MSPDRDCVNTLPRLAYVGEVPVESSYHGSALLYRLLQRYPADRLRIVEVLNASQPARRLPGVEYNLYRPLALRMLSTRFHALIEPAVLLSAPWMAGDLARRCLAGFRPEAVLTVAHNLGWMPAAALAESRALPMHLIIHDDWPGFAWKDGLVNGIVGKRFARTYGKAASRFCVSPYMAEEYERRYGESGIVLYPSRAANAAFFDSPMVIRANSRPFTIAYAGTLFTADYAHTLRTLAKVLGKLGGRLVLFGPFDSAQLKSLGLDLANVGNSGLVSSEDLIRHLRGVADALFVPMSFAESDRQPMRFNFPSKLADYTRAALPLLIAGPSDSSAMQWAISNPSVAEIVPSNSFDSLSAAVSKLMGDPAYCRQLALAAVDIGRRYFSHATAESTLFGQLRKENEQSSAR